MLLVPVRGKCKRYFVADDGEDRLLKLIKIRRKYYSHAGKMHPNWSTSTSDLAVARGTGQ